ncbi:MAG TPA: hypothetical protein VM735_03465, partial [Candidatus Kapabacteria bacterium]|nr:hypothetical protein [Candidatus Kapabacteria bacterium]
MANFPRLNVLRAQLGVVLLIWTVVSGWSSGPGGSGSEYPPPANDNFADRTRLEGSTVEIKGTLKGATTENGENFTTVTGNPPWFMAWSSVWFSWKAPATGIGLIVPKTKTSAFVTVTTGTNVSSAQEMGHLVAELDFPKPYAPNRYATFNTDANVEYQIRVFGMDTNEFEISLGLTNLPIILEEPKSQTASQGGCALFTVSTVAHEGQLATIRWQLNGTNLPGRTGPTLALTNVSESTTGEYRAVVTNPMRNENGQFISRTSSVVQLVVKEPSSPRLNIHRAPTGMMVDIQGDAGLSYVLESGGLPLSAQTGWGPAYAVFVSPDSFPYRLGSGPGGEVGIGEIVRARTQPTSICN